MKLCKWRLQSVRLEPFRSEYFALSHIVDGIMFKSKSFDLVNEEKTKEPERLYQPRRMRWMKYIILPAVFAFVLLLILVNVDFSDNTEEVACNLTALTLPLEVDAGGFVMAESTISVKENTTIPMAKDPEITGVTTTEGIFTSIDTKTTTSTTREYTTSTTSSPTTSSPTTEESSSTTTSTISPTTESPNCDEATCQEYVCSVPQAGNITISMPYEMILKFKDLTSHTVQIAISECAYSQMRIIYYINRSVDEESLDLMLSNVTLSSDCGTPTLYCVQLGEDVGTMSSCLPNSTLICEVYTSQTESWFETHGGLVIGLGVALVLISSLLGMLILYGTLRWKPSLLKGSQHQNNPSRDSNSVGLIPQESEKNEYGIAGAPISTLDNNEYIVAYHRYLEQANLRHMESNKYISPPRERAPSVPPSCDSHPSLPLPLPARNVYESLDLYEELP